MSTRSDLADISTQTLAHYDANADSFEAGTRDHDVSQNIAALLRHIDRPAPARLLDFGCGPGRDLKTLVRLGHEPVGLDGSAAFVTMARDATGCTVWHQDFFALDLPPDRFDGIFANASLQHVPKALLPKVLRQLHASLSERGVLFASIPRGSDDGPGEEGWNNERYSAWHNLDGWRGFLSAAGFEELEHYFRPAGAPHAEQRWLASVWRKCGSAKSQDAA